MHNGLPCGPLPESAPESDVKNFSKGRGNGPSIDKVQYNWRGGLKKCKWNKQATALLGEEYIGLLQSHGIKYQGIPVPYDPEVLDIFSIQGTISKRLSRTHILWKQENMTVTSMDTSEDEDDSMTPHLSPSQQAEKKLKSGRHRARAQNV